MIALLLMLIVQVKDFMFWGQLQVVFVSVRFKSFLMGFFLDGWIQAALINVSFLVTRLYVYLKNLIFLGGGDLLIIGHRFWQSQVVVTTLFAVLSRVIFSRIRFTGAVRVCRFDIGCPQILLLYPAFTWRLYCADFFIFDRLWTFLLRFRTVLGGKRTLSHIFGSRFLGCDLLLFWGTTLFLATVSFMVPSLEQNLLLFLESHLLPFW